MGEAGGNAMDVDFEYGEKPAIGDVAGGDEKKSGRMTAEDMGVEKVGILGNDHCSIRVCDGGNGGVRGAVSCSQINLKRKMPQVLPANFTTDYADFD